MEPDSIISNGILKNSQQRYDRWTGGWETCEFSKPIGCELVVQGKRIQSRASPQAWGDTSRLDKRDSAAYRMPRTT